MNLNEIKEKLKSFYFLENINDERIDELCEKTKTVFIEKDKILFRKGEQYHKGLYLIYDGKVQLTSPDFKNELILSNGDVVGVMAFVGKSTYNANAVILEDSELIFLPDV